MDWDGDAIHVQHFKIDLISQSLLQNLKKSSNKKQNELNEAKMDVSASGSQPSTENMIL